MSTYGALCILISPNRYTVSLQKKSKLLIYYLPIWRPNKDETSKHGRVKPFAKYCVSLALRYTKSLSSVLWCRHAHLFHKGYIIWPNFDTFECVTEELFWRIFYYFQLVYGITSSRIIVQTNIVKPIQNKCQYYKWSRIWNVFLPHLFCPTSISSGICIFCVAGVVPTIFSNEWRYTLQVVSSQT